MIYILVPLLLYKRYSRHIFTLPLLKIWYARCYIFSDVATRPYESYIFMRAGIAFHIAAVSFFIYYYIIFLLYGREAGHFLFTIIYIMHKNRKEEIWYARCRRRGGAIKILSRCAAAGFSIYAMAAFSPYIAIIYMIFFMPARMICLSRAFAAALSASAR